MTRPIATRAQLRYLRDLARRAGIEPLTGILWASDARKAITRLERHLRDTAEGRQEAML